MLCRLLGGLERWDLSIDTMAADNVEAAAAADTQVCEHSSADQAGAVTVTRPAPAVADPDCMVQFCELLAEVRKKPAATKGATLQQVRQGIVSTACCCGYCCRHMLPAATVGATLPVVHILCPDLTPQLSICPPCFLQMHLALLNEKQDRDRTYKAHEGSKVRA